MKHFLLRSPLLIFVLLLTLLVHVGSIMPLVTR